MDDKRRERLLSRLKKCLALSNSPEPHEAAAALRQAQAMMRELGITEADLIESTVADRVVKTREGFGKCLTMSWLIDVITRAFGVRAVQEQNPGSANRLNVRYYGPEDRTLLAEYSHRVVWNAMQSAWDAHLLKNPQLKGKGGQRQAFHIGWLRGVRRTIEDFAPTRDETTAMDLWRDRKYGGSLEKVEHGKKELDPKAMAAGYNASKDFSLHVPLEEQQGALEHHKES